VGFVGFTDSNLEELHKRDGYIEAALEGESLNLLGTA